MPDVFRNGLFNPLTSRIAGEVAQHVPRARAGEIANISQFLHPLDVLGEWIRAHGPAGFLQYSSPSPTVPSSRWRIWYFGKDSRTTPEMIRRMYPRLDEWRRVRDSVDPEGVFTSDLSRRLGINAGWPHWRWG